MNPPCYNQTAMQIRKQHHETELKFSLSETVFSSLENTQEKLQADFADVGLHFVMFETCQQHDRYFDINARLQRANMGLRQRIVGTERYATLKCLRSRDTAQHDFVELTVPMPLEEAKWPQDIREALRGIAFTSRLQCILEMDTHRLSYSVACSGQHIATLCFDEVSASLPDSVTSGHFSELEIEFVDANQRHIDKWAPIIVKVLEARLAMNPTSHNKLERAQILLAHTQMMQDI